MSEEKCTGDSETCEAMGGECMECGERDCPHKDRAHYSRDGCPSCGDVTPQELIETLVHAMDSKHLKEARTLAEGLRDKEGVDQEGWMRAVSMLGAIDAEERRRS